MIETWKHWSEQDAQLRAGRRVKVYWGYGLGFRAEGIGTITRVFAKSVRVKLDEEVAAPYGGEPWPAGFELMGIPRFGLANDQWKAYENGVELVED